MPRAADLADLAGRLVACDTTSANSNAPAVDLLADRLEASGCRVRVQRWTVDGVAKANLVAAVGPPVAGGLILCGHVDTVPFADQPGWERDPLALEIGDERVYGRGTTDMKVFLAQAVLAAGALDGSRLAHPLVLAFTADEEIGCLGASRLADEIANLLGDVPLPTACWIGEPTSWQVHNVHKSVTIFDVLIRGRGGHSGLPSLGASAIAAAGRVIEALNRYQTELQASPSPAFAAAFPEAPTSTLNLGTIRGGTAANMIAEECAMRVSTRGMPDLDPVALQREVRRRLAAIDTRDLGSPITISVTEPLVVPAMHTAPGTPLERALLERMGQGAASGSLLAADGCRLEPLGVRSLICGPGDFDEAHQPNESISRRAFEEGTAVIRSIVERICCG